MKKIVGYGLVTAMAMVLMFAIFASAGPATGFNIGTETGISNTTVTKSPREGIGNIVTTSLTSPLTAREGTRTPNTGKGITGTTPNNTKHPSTYHYLPNNGYTNGEDVYIGDRVTY